MFLDIPLFADFQVIRYKQQVLVNEGLRRQNSWRHHWDFHVEQDVSIKLVVPRKLGEQTHGPYRIMLVNTNGIITVRKNPFVT